MYAGRLRGRARTPENEETSTIEGVVGVAWTKIQGDLLSHPK